MHRLKTFAFFAGLTAWITAAVAEPLDGDFVIEPDMSKVSYKLIHKFHEVVGVSRAIEGRAVLTKGEGRVMVRIPVGTFDSGNKNRDAHAKEVLEAHKHPYVVFKGAISPDSAQTDLLHIKGTLLFHGVEKPIELDVALVQKEPHVALRLSFPVSLDEHSVERPSLLFVKVDDRIMIEGELAFTTQSR